MMNQPNTAPDESLSGETRARLIDVRSNLLRLHKALLEAERAAYERRHGKVASSGAFLNLVINDPWFAWLRAWSELVVQIDEAMADKKNPLTERAAQDYMEQARALTKRADEDNPAFLAQYRAAMQRSSEAVVAHAALTKSLRAAA